MNSNGLGQLLLGQTCQGASRAQLPPCDNIGHWSVSVHLRSRFRSGRLVWPPPAVGDGSPEALQAFAARLQLAVVPGAFATLVQPDAVRSAAPIVGGGGAQRPAVVAPAPTPVRPEMRNSRN